MATEIIVALIGAAGVVLNGLVLRKQNTSEKARQDGAERMEILLESVEACLNGVHQLGANGRTTAALRKLEDYKNKKAAK